MDVAQFLVFATIGVFAGGVGGLLGIGGSTIFIPAATLLFGEDQQSYQATAMILNAFVAITATIKHTRNGLVKKEIVIPMGIETLTFGPIFKNLLGGNSVNAMLFAAVFFVIASVLAMRLNVKKAKKEYPLDS